jgi:hypothetical protein
MNDQEKMIMKRPQTAFENWIGKVHSSDTSSEVAGNPKPVATPNQTLPTPPKRTRGTKSHIDGG